MSSVDPMNRRAFLQRSLWGGVAAAFVLPRRLTWGQPLAAPAASLRLAFYTDIHARTEWDTPEAMMKAAGRIAALKPDLSVCGGDMITDGFQSQPATVAPRWDVYMAMQEAVGGAVYPVIGNHDIVAAKPEDGSAAAEDPRAEFLRRMGRERTWCGFDAEGYHFILLDSINVLEGDTPYEGRISEDQLQWLRSHLEGVDADRPIILCSHIPLLTAYYVALYGVDQAPSPSRVVVNAREVLQCFDAHNLVLVLQGHLHVNEMIRWKNTTFITGGAVCGKWWRGSWQDTDEGFGLVTLNGDRVAWEYMSYGWEARRPRDQ